MNTERFVVLSSFLEIAKSSSRESAIVYLSDWMKREKASDVLKAGGYYLAHFVIPALEGEETFLKPLPRWVDRALFHPPVENIETVEDFLSLFQGTWCEMLKDKKKNAPQTQLTPSSKRIGSSPSREVLDWASTNGWGVFFTPNAIQGWRDEAHCTGVNAFFADFDDCDKARQKKIIASLPLPPSLIVESLRGFHTYWLLNEVSTQFETWKGIQKTIIRVCDSDRALTNIDRLMRLPFTQNHKYDEPFTVRIESFTGRFYEFIELEMAFPPEKQRPRIRYEGPRTLHAPLPCILSEGQRHGTLIEEAGRIYTRLPQEKAAEAREIIREWYQRSCNPLKPDWEDEVKKVCDWTELREYGVM